MMLIDKDRLLKGSNHYWLEMENFGDIEAIDVRFIEMADEVKAIPIEWIKKWCNKEHNRKSLEERLLKRYGVITMLDDWKKENETN